MAARAQAFEFTQRFRCASRYDKLVSVELVADTVTTGATLPTSRAYAFDHNCCAISTRAVRTTAVRLRPSIESSSRQANRGLPAMQVRAEVRGLPVRRTESVRLLSNWRLRRPKRASISALARAGGRFCHATAIK
jgi:hypothetical protein